MKKRVVFAVPQKMIFEPILYTINQLYGVTPSIYVSDMTDKGGSMKLELEGEKNQIEEAIDWVASKGIRVEPVK